MRVFPVPPGPVSVTMPAPGRASSSAMDDDERRAPNQLAALERELVPGREVSLGQRARLAPARARSQFGPRRARRPRPPPWRSAP